ncbi:MAG: O-antigen ligase family protein [Candidatus Limnocylindria bacterium]
MAVAAAVRPFRTSRRRWILAGIALVGIAAALLAGLAIGSGLATLAIAVALAPFALLVLNYPFAAIVVWALVLPFFTQASDATPSTWILHRAMIPGLLLLVTIYHFLGIRRSAFRLHVYDLAVAAFIIVAVVNVVLLSPNPERVLVALFDKAIVPIAIFWYVRVIGVSGADLKRLVIVGAFVIVSQTAIGMLSWIAPSLLPDAWLARAGERTAGTFGGPAPFTITLTFFALLAIYFAGRASSRETRAILLAVVATALTGVFFSLSRGSWLGTGVATAGLLLLYPRIVATVAIGGLLLFGLLAVGPLQEQVALAAVRLDTESTIDDRLVTNEASFRMIGDRPLQGFGFQNFERFDEAYKQRVGDIPLKIGGSSHNTYLNLAVEMGVPAVGLYFAPVAALALATMRLRKRLPDGGVISGPLLLVLWLALADQFVVSNFLEMLHAYPWGTAVWWLTLGLIAAIIDAVPTRARPVWKEASPGLPS